MIRENSSSIQWDGVYFAILHQCQQKGWEVETHSKGMLHRAKICELTEQYSCLTAISTISVIDALLQVYLEFLQTKDTLDKPELANGDS